MSRGKPDDVIDVFNHNEVTNRRSTQKCTRTQAAQLVWSGLAKWTHKYKIVLEKHARGLSASLICEPTSEAAKSCIFPARALRKHSAHLVAEIRDIAATEGYSPRVTARLRLGMQITKLRLDHEALNGCRCWYTPAEIEINDALDAEIPPSAGAKHDAFVGRQ